MKKTLKKLLSLLLVLSMVASLTVTGWAEDETDSHENAHHEGVELEMEDLDPASLNVPRLGVFAKGEELPAAEEAQLHSLDDIVRVSIFLTEPGALDAGYARKGVGTDPAAVSYRDGLERRQDQVTAAIERATGGQLDVVWNLTLAVNAISANVRYGDIVKICAVDGVDRVELENRYEAQTGETAQPNTANTSQYMVGAAQTWGVNGSGYTGAGSKVAIIDTGVDYTHQSFNADAFNHAVEQVRAAGKTVTLMTQSDWSGLKLNGSGRYVSAKFPFGYNYVDQTNATASLGHTNDTQGEHGSHVAGIAAANRFIKSGSSYVDAASSVSAVGMAPDAQILIMKVFGAKGGAYDSDYMVAIEDAITMGCDAANLSLGSGDPGWTYDNSYQDVLNSLVDTGYNTGTVVSISAVNSGALPDELKTNLYEGDVYMHTGGSPGSFVNSLCVASADNIGSAGTPLVFNGNRNVFYTESTSGSDGTAYSNPAYTTIKGTYNYVYIDTVGNAADYTTVNKAVSLSGKIVIVNRGELSFSEKGNNAKGVSPKGVLIANNQSGTIAMDLSDFTGTFPMASITLADADAIKAASTKGTTGGITYYTGSVQVTDTVSSGVSGTREDALVSDFSSWGVPGSLLMKPEITAPGGSIYSVFGTNKLSSGSTAGGSDKYELMSGTSMAAPHITGLSAVVAQYLRENPVKDRNDELDAGYVTRAIIQSLLMSTATPMKPNGDYLSILQQGAGLVEVNRAVSAGSVLMMNDAYLTTATKANADGKVKVELGDDPGRKGEYTYSFTLYNLTDQNETFTLNTDLFTQAQYEDDGQTFMDYGTAMLPSGGVSYTWDGESAASGHDVNLDGVTDEKDAQAILDLLTGKIDDYDLDYDAGDLDGDGKASSYDAHLLLNWKPEASTGYVLPAHGKARVTVTINLTPAQREALEEFSNGAYLQGFTYATGTTADGESHQHSIPILGFYGSWTDPSMFDNTSYVDTLYGRAKTPYSGNTNTNFLTATVNGTTARFTGNPYMVEETFPADRLAMNSQSTMGSLTYNLIRSAGTTGFAVSKVDERQGLVTEVVNASVIANDVTGLWYYQSQGAWQNTGSKVYTINKTPASYGLKAGDVFRVGFYAIPEYNAMMLSDDMTDGGAGQLGSAGFRQVLSENTLGLGAFVGYDFVVDNEEPVVETPTLNGSKLTVTATDNENLAYVAVLSLDGKTTYAEAAPGKGEYSVTFDASSAIANAPGYVAVFAGDYAGNEVAEAVKVNNNTGSTDPYAVDSVTVTPASLDLYKGNTATLTAKVLPLTASDRTVTWSSANTSVATVDANGIVTAVGAGSTTIRAAANGNTGKYAQCTVNVTSVNKTLNGIIWDEEGGVYFSSFNASSLPAWNKLHNDAKGLELHSAFMANANTLYAGTLDMNAQSTVLYSVNRSTYALTEYGTNYVMAFDAARSNSASNYVYAFANYLVYGNIAPTYDSQAGGTFSGIPSALLDVSETNVGDAYIAAVAAKSVGTSSVYYFLDETGKIWQTTMRSRTFSTPTLVVDTGISTSFLYQTLYYDGTYLYWGHQTDNEAELIIINPSTKTIYHAGNFGEGVWPTVGIYVNGSAAPAAVDEEIMESEEPAELTDLTPVMSREEMMTPEIMARIAAEAERMGKTAPAASETESFGGLNAVRTDRPAAAPAVSDKNTVEIPQENDNGTITVTISEIGETNGVYSVDYNPTVLGLVDVERKQTYASYHVDENEDDELDDEEKLNIVAIAFASKEALTDANKDVAVLTFKPLACGGGEAVVNVTTNEKGADMDVEQVEEHLTIQLPEHAWGDWTVTKAPTCTEAGEESRTCSNCGKTETHPVEALGHDYVATVTAPTCTERGYTTYTCSRCGDSYVDDYVPALGHEWSFTEFTWTGDDTDGYTAVANYTCSRCSETETVAAAMEKTSTDATCTEAGTVTYTATVSAANSLDGKAHTDSKTETGVALGHDWGEWTVTKSPACTEAGEESRTCSRCKETEKRTIEAQGHDYVAVVTEPTCTERGYTTHTCSRCGDSYVDSYVPALGHDWGEWTVTKAPTCTEAGEESRTCSRCNETEKRTTEATGHNYGQPTYTWSADNSKVTATVVCANDQSHVITETANTTSQVTKEATRESAGEITYTATFDNPAFATQTRTEVIPALPAMTVERFAGQIRTETAVAISQGAFPNGAENVILASGDDYPDALAGGPLAYQLNAPILLIRRSQPDKATLDEIKRLGAKHAYILGGAGVVGDNVADTVKGMGLTVERLAGADRFETAAAIARKLEQLRGVKPSEVFVVFARNYPDALSISNVAAVKGAPILYIDGNGQLRPSTENYLKQCGKVEKSYVLGGPGLIAPQAETSLGAYSTVERIYGDDRYDTCIRVNNRFADVLNGDSLCLACGTNYPDALAGSVFAALKHSPLLLVRTTLTDGQQQYIHAKDPAHVYIFGGTGVVSEEIVDQVKAAAK